MYLNFINVDNGNYTGDNIGSGGWNKDVFQLINNCQLTVNYIEKLGEEILDKFNGAPVCNLRRNIISDPIVYYVSEPTMHSTLYTKLRTLYSMYPNLV